jgi:NAD(P)-dependent dehydrogenase (short-subunit alcohol dehydrogenase family)
VYLARTFSLKGHKALVTGASSGLGLHIAGCLAKAGAALVLAARRSDDLIVLKLCLQNRRKKTKKYRQSAVERGSYTPMH